jgi:hypothetical protein
MCQAAIHCLIVTLVLSFTRDPFTHLHARHDHQADEPGHEHLALIFHTHIEMDSSPSPHDDEPEISNAKASAKAQPLSFFQFRPETSPPLPALMQERALLSPLVCLISKISEPPPRAHDPPVVHSSIPRSPPV